MSWMSSESSLDLAIATFIRFIATSSQPKPISYHETLCVLLAGTRKPIFASFRFGHVELSEWRVLYLSFLPFLGHLVVHSDFLWRCLLAKWSLSHTGPTTRVKLFYYVYRIAKWFPYSPTKKHVHFCIPSCAPLFLSSRLFVPHSHDDDQCSFFLLLSHLQTCMHGLLLSRCKWKCKKVCMERVYLPCTLSYSISSCLFWWDTIKQSKFLNWKLFQWNLVWKICVGVEVTIYFPREEACKPGIKILGFSFVISYDHLLHNK